MDYDFDRTPLTPKTDSRFRRIVIFLVVFAVTGGILYWIVPHESPKAVATPATPHAVAAENVAPAEKELIPATEAETPAPAETASALETVAATEEKDKTVTPTEKPVKGVPWQGDPAVDEPEKPIPAPQLEKEAQLSQENWKLVETCAAPWCIRYTVASGDNLERLANRYHTTTAAIKELNHLKSNTIFLGKKLKIVPGPWQIEISKSARRLQLFNLANGKTLFAAYDVGVGRANSTPAEKFVISIRLFHPDYRAPNGAIYPYGDAENPMGDYFLKLAKASQKNHPLAGYGIHGSPDDAGVGRSLSHGCVRMRNADVRQIYLLCPVGTVVSISE